MNLPPSGEFKPRALLSSKAILQHTITGEIWVTVTYDDLESRFGASLYEATIENFQLMAHNLKAGFLEDGYACGELQTIIFESEFVRFIFESPRSKLLVERQAFIERMKGQNNG